MSDTVLVQIDNGLATLTLNRPKALNALNLEMAIRLAEACEAVEQDASVRCVVIKGAGGHFLAGGDVPSFKTGLDNNDNSDVDQIITNVHIAIESIRRMQKPVVASAEGAVAGFGMSLLVACDLAIATNDTKYTMAYSLLGANPDGGSTYHLPRMVGLKRAMELCLLSDRFGAQQALDIGIVNQLVAPEELQAATEKLCSRLVAGPRQAYGRIKQLLNQSFSNDLTEQLHAEHTAFMEGVQTQEFAEGVTAFCEKRKPDFLKNE